MTTNDDKLVTHEDLVAARGLVAAADRYGTTASRELAQAILAAAEADQPPLPEDWVLHFDDVSWHPYWHEQGHLYKCKAVDGGTALVARVGESRYTRDRLTPLRPTVTEADVEKVARAARAAYFDGVDAWDAACQSARDAWMGTVRATLDALDIEVRS